MHAKDLGRLHGQWAVHEDRHGGDAVLLNELMQEVDDGLRAAEAKRGDEDLAAASHRACDHCRQRVGQGAGRGVRPAAVGAFGNEQISRRDGRGVAQDRHAAPAHVAGERERSPGPIVPHRHMHHRRAEQVPGINQTHGDPVPHVEIGVIRNGMD